MTTDEAKTVRLTEGMIAELRELIDEKRGAVRAGHEVGHPDQIDWALVGDATKPAPRDPMAGFRALPEETV